MEYSHTFFILLICVVLALPAMGAPVDFEKLVSATGAPLSSTTQIKPYPITKEGGAGYTLYLVVDANLPVGYYRKVFTEVCASNSCVPISITLYWDLLGRYAHYRLPPEEKLTKRDHVPFEPADYKKLHEILKNDRSILNDLDVKTIAETSAENSPSINAITGATPKTLDQEVIAGALYTCYTLWHQAHGSIREDVQGVTRTLINDALLRNFLSGENYRYRTWAVDWVFKHSELVDRFLPELLELLKGENYFAAQHVMKEIPTATLQSETIQQELYPVYRGGMYGLKLMVLERMQEVALTEALLIDLAGELQSSNESLFTKIMALLAQAESLPEKALDRMVVCLETRPPQYGDQVYSLLRNQPDITKDLKQKLDQYQQTRKESTQR